VSATAIHPGSVSPGKVLGERCAALGLPTWRFGPDGSALSAPQASGLACQWLRSRVVQRLVERAVGAWIEETEPRPAEVFPGCWLIPLVETCRRRRCAITVAMALGPRAMESEEFLAACQSARLDALAARTMMAPMAKHAASTIPGLASMLGWTRDDLEALAVSTDSLAGFGRQLSDCYEEINLLYTLGESMNQLVHPQRFVQLCCDELHATLPYRWIAARFSADRRLARGMADRVFESGSTPTPRAVFARATSSILASLEPDQKLVLSGGSCQGLASGDSQVLVHPVVRDGAVVGAVFAGEKNGPDRQISSVDRKMLDAAAAHTSILLDNAFLYDDQQLMFVGTLESLSASIDAKDPYTRGHSERVAHLAGALAQAHGLDEEHADRFRIAGIVHDVGKIGVPEAVLTKTGRLTQEEFAQMKRHPEIGFQILKDIPMMDDVLPGVLHHHERYDGAGYPHGLAGERIPLVARVLGLADAFDAMSSHRTYRSAMVRGRVFQELSENAGRQFDPALVSSFMRVDLARYDELVERQFAQSQRPLLIRGAEGDAKEEAA